MTYYNYDRLSPRDFELLSADIIEAKEEVRVERFAVGPDGGIDLRFVDSGKKAIVQSKRIGVWSQLRGSVKQEREKIEKLNCDRYILVTSCSLTPGNKEQLKELIGPSLKTSEDIITGDDVDALLEKYPEVKKRHLKLWIKDAEELSTILNKGLYQLNAYYIEELFHHARVFVEHKYVSEVDNFLAKSHCCLITGEPGVGKTALAGYMALQYSVVRDYGVVIVGSGEVRDAWSLIRNENRQIIILDDFLGPNFLNRESDARFERDLIALIRKVSSGKGRHKLLLTSRDYVFQQAVWKLEHLEREADLLHQIRINLESVPNTVKAEILYSHLFQSDISENALSQFVGNRSYRKVIEHKNYNPRLVQSIVRTYPEKPSFSDWFKDKLDSPESFWEHAFRKLSVSAQSLLYCLAASGSDVLLDDLKRFYYSVRQRLNGGQHIPDSFKGAVREVEPNFAVTFEVDGTVCIRFSNPGVSDMVQQVISRSRDVVGVLLECFTHFQQGFLLYSFDDKFPAPVSLDKEQRNELLFMLADKVKYSLGKVRQIWFRGDVAQRIEKNSIGENLSTLWWLVERADYVRQDMVEKLNPYLQAESPWEDYFQNADYSNLLALIRYVSEEQTQMQAWHAAISSLKNSEDAVSVAEEVALNQRFRYFITREKIDLGDLLDDLCYSEVEMLEDEDHIGAVLSDIDTIESKLGVDLDLAKFEAWEHLERIQTENEHEDEPLGGFSTEKQSKNDESMAYIDALFEGLVRE